jgi:hypothetical protein
MRFDDVTILVVGAQPLRRRLDSGLQILASRYEMGHHHDAAVMERVMAFEDPFGDLCDQFVAGLELVPIHR